MSRRITQVTVISIHLKPPIYHEVERCVRRFAQGKRISVDPDEDPIRKMFAAIFPGWTLFIVGWKGDLEHDVISVMADNPADHTIRIQPPQGNEEPNMLITTSCPDAYF